MRKTRYTYEYLNASIKYYDSTGSYRIVKKLLFIRYGKCNGKYLKNNDMVSKVEKLYTRSFNIDNVYQVCHNHICLLFLFALIYANR